jgi:hypothetical protein
MINFHPLVSTMTHFIDAVIARQGFDKFLCKSPVLRPRYRCDGPHAATRSSLTDDPVTEKDKAVVHVSNMGFRHIEREL